MYMKVTVYESSSLQSRYYTEKELAYGEADEQLEGNIINIVDDAEYQEILGFGGAFTEAAAYNYSLLDEETKKDFLKKYFDREEGIGYNFGRTHISSCDFALDVYSYVEEGDMTLETFSIERDRKYIIPFLKDAMKVCKDDLVLMASPWSPPAYMKTNNNALQGGMLKEEYRKLWALYYAKYIKAYRAEGISITAISIQNEPKAVQTWESCVWSATQEREFIQYDLLPVFEAEGLSDIKIIIWDHNKERVYERAKDVLSSKVVEENVWAVGHHWYSGEHFEGLSLVQEQLHKPNISTEFCVGDDGFGIPLNNAEKYAKHICQNLNHYMIASCDWNLLLDDEGGPFHNRISGGCNAPVRYDRSTGKLEYTPVYYYIGHFSKYIRRGAKRLGITRFTDDLYACAFRNPDDSIVAVVMNPTDVEQEVVFRHQKKNTIYVMPAHSIATVRFQEV